MSKTPNLTTSVFHKAYDLARQNPGQPVDFEGTLPSGYVAKQKIVRVPSSENPLKVAYAIGQQFPDAKVSTGSSVERGTHVVATFGDLRPAL